MFRAGAHSIGPRPKHLCSAKSFVSLRITGEATVFADRKAQASYLIKSSRLTAHPNLINSFRYQLISILRADFSVTDYEHSCKTAQFIQTLYIGLITPIAVITVSDHVDVNPGARHRVDVWLVQFDGVRVSFRTASRHDRLLVFRLGPCVG